MTASPLRAATQADQPVLLEVDAGEAPQRIYHARLIIPVEPGPLTLYYPKWIPGNHGPTGPIADLAGLKMHADGKAVRWRRDDVDMYAFHCTVPNGARQLEVALDLLAAERGGFLDATQNIAVVRWNQVLLYPKGKPIQAIEFQAALKIPAGWKLSTALPIESNDGETTHFRPVSLETLVDSPVIAGRYHREIRLGSGEPAPYLDLVSDSPEGLEITPKQKAAYEKLVAEAGALFGTQHYRSYRFLVTLSDKMPVHGLEHHESSDDGLPEHALSDDEASKLTATLLPHEYVHSWNGKYRRPAGLVTPTYQEPSNTRLLWVYEGLTQYLGTVLTARSGLWTPQETRDSLAMTAQRLQNTRGRGWRPLEDTTLTAPMRAYDASGWSALRRSVDYYDEGTLIWLEVDTKIRQLTKGKRSLDDFCRHFFGGPSGTVEVKPYNFDDLVAALNAVAPYDWKSLLSRTPDGNGRPGAVRRLSARRLARHARRETDRVRESDQRPPQANRSLVVDRPHAHARRADQRRDSRLAGLQSGRRTGHEARRGQHAAVQPESAGRGSRSLEKAGAIHHPADRGRRLLPLVRRRLPRRPPLRASRANQRAARSARQDSRPAHRQCGEKDAHRQARQTLSRRDFFRDLRH